MLDTDQWSVGGPLAGHTGKDWPWVDQGMRMKLALTSGLRMGPVVSRDPWVDLILTGDQQVGPMLTSSLWMSPVLTNN